MCFMDICEVKSIIEIFRSNISKNWSKLDRILAILTFRAVLSRPTNLLILLLTLELTNWANFWIHITPWLGALKIERFIFYFSTFRPEIPLFS